MHGGDWSFAGCIKARLSNENKRLESRWAALRGIFQITIDNCEDDPRYYYDVMTAKSVIEEMDKLESEG